VSVTLNFELRTTSAAGGDNMESTKVLQLNHNRNLTSRLTPPDTVPAIAPRPKLLDQVGKAIRTRHYSPKTEESYVHWIKRFVFFHNKRHPAEMAEKEIAQFLSSLANELHVSASTQNQALNAILFLYREVLHKKIGYINGVVRAKRPHRLPVVLTRQEVKSILGILDPSDWLMAVLLYGAGLRLMECLRLRVKDIEFTSNQIVIRAGKGDKDRHTMLPAAAKDPLTQHLDLINNTSAIWIAAGAESLCQTLSIANIPMREKSGDGNGYFQQRATTRIGQQEKNADIICTNPFCRKQ
jgi:integrase